MMDKAKSGFGSRGKEVIMTSAKVVMMACFLIITYGCDSSAVSQNREILQRIGELEEKIAAAADKQAIHDVLNRYARALDWLDAERLDRVFFDDSEVDYGFFKGSGKEFKPLVMKIEESIGRRWHHTSQVSIDLNGDTADVESYGVSYTSMDPEAIEGTKLGQYMGFYQDRFEKRDGKWGIAYRKYVMFSTVMLEETVLDGDLSVFHKIGNATMDSPHFRDIGN